MLPAVETLPLEAIEPGMQGEWVTVVSGDELVRYNFEVVGISPDFIGPGKDVILVKATDSSQILSGPVGGMSGSPCYIDGKLIGAYAYGYTWPKEQALIGITPIAYMLDMLDEPKAGTAHGRAAPAPAIEFEERLSAAVNPERASALLKRYAEAGTTMTAAEPKLQSLPLPFFSSGLSANMMEPFRQALAAHGFATGGAPMGTSTTLTADDIRPGSALAGVLLDGDFRMAATGTVTWREGKRFLAFGHPFLGEGAVAIPAAPAEILTVVQSVPHSFKLANVGPVVGGITQDRLSAVAGEIGPIPPRTELAVDLTYENGKKSYKGMLFRNQQLAPLVSGIGLLYSLVNTMETAREQTFYATLRFAIEGHPPLEIERVASGPGAAFSLAMMQWMTLSVLVDNPFAEAVVNRVHWDIRVANKWDQQTLEGIQMISTAPTAGHDFSLQLTLGKYQAPPEQRFIAVPLPEGSQGQSLKLLIGDAEAADRLEYGGSPARLSSFDGLLRVLQRQRPNDRIYVKLLRPAGGLQLDGQALPSLPPSVLQLMQTPRNQTLMQPTRWETLWETELRVSGLFQGSHILPLDIQ